MRTAIVAALALLTGSATVMAQAPALPPVTHVKTVSDLAAICDPAWDGVPRLEAIAYCQGFLTSVSQYHALLHPRNGPGNPLYCVPPPGPSIAESGIGFAAWARENPKYGPEPALDGFFRWAQARFPCPSVAGAAPKSPAKR